MKKKKMFIVTREISADSIEQALRKNGRVTHISEVVEDKIVDGFKK